MLAKFIRSNPQIHGIKTKTKEYKISLLADDSLIFISNPNHLQFDRLFDTLKHFGKLSGCNLNISKSNAFHVGPARHCGIKFYADSGLQWPSDYITYLGIKIPTSKFLLEQSFNLNLTPKLTSIKIICNIWGKYNLTFFGKITIIKSLIFSRLLYPLTCTPCIPPKRFIKDLNLILFKFIWGGKWERAKRDTRICPIEEGGIGMIHLESYIAATQLKWTRDLFTGKFEFNWHNIEHQVLRESGIDLYFCGNVGLRSNLFKHIPLKSLKVSLTAWHKYRSRSPSAGYPFNQCLWQNKAVKISKKIYADNELATVGILEYFQLLNSTGNYLTFNSLCQTYNISTNPHTFSWYLKLIKSIPCSWKEIACENITTQTSVGLLKVSLDNELFMFKNMYNFFVNIHRQPPPKSQLKYADLCNIDARDFDWSKRYLLLN